MGVKDILRFIKARRDEATDKEEMPDDMTRDNYLRSLRRERRVQMEKVEKERLKTQIAAFKKKEMVEGVFGIKKPVKLNGMMGKKKKKKLGMMSKMDSEPKMFFK